jgi:hypothetical protein
MMRKPRDLEKYSPARRLAVWLRVVADDIEAHAEVHPLVKLGSITLSFWNPEWEERKSEKGIKVRRVGSTLTPTER